MEKLVGSILFCFAINCCFTSATNREIREDICFADFDRTNKSDTTKNYQLIKIDSFNLNILSPSFGIQFYRDGIVFLSQSKNVAKMVPIHISFGTTQAYYATIKDSVLADLKVFSPSFPFPYPCDAISFSNDYNTMYFTKRRKNDNAEKIYQSNYTSGGKTSGGWIDSPKPMDFCYENSAYTHPSISTDGKIIIFASDKIGSLGGMDLFITRKAGEKWSKPENMGEAINTLTNELFPFLDSENNLFFSSDGLKGFGGYDIFMCKFNGKIWEKPVNLTKHINSKNDDVAFTLNRQDGKLAFYTTIEKTNKKRKQLYKVTLNNRYTSDNLINISDALYAITQSGITLPEKIIAATITPEAKKEEVKPPEKTVNPVTVPEKKTVKPVTSPEEKTVKPVTLPENKTVIEPEPKVKPPETKVETTKPVISTPAEKNDIVIYRVQFLSSIKPQGNNQILINGKSYNTFRYFYLGEYRYTVGEFSTLASAKEFQTTLRKSGYPQSFVVAFKNNIRSLDPALFK